MAEFPRTEPIAYDYVYEDTGPIAEEIDEWFMYNFFQWVRLNSAHRNYMSLHKEVLGEDEDGSAETLEKLVRAALGRITVDDDASPRNEAIGALVYAGVGAMGRDGCRCGPLERDRWKASSPLPPKVSCKR